MAMSPSEDSSFHVQTDLEIQIVLAYYYYYYFYYYYLFWQEC